MRYQEIIDTVFEELSGINAKEHVMHLTHYDRIQASPGFRAAAEYVCRLLNEWGFDNAKIMEFPADGKINQWDWESPIAWKADEGELWLIEPYKELLCDYRQIPLCLIAHSQSALTVANLVDVGTGTDESEYRNEKIKDSIIMATGSARDIYPLMHKYGVQGLIRYPSNVQAFNNPDMIIHDSFWPVDDDRDIIPFGFSISKRQAERLKSLIAEGKRVRIKAKVNADLGDGHLDIVDAHIPCDEEDAGEILMIAHLCNPKPSANNNASGCGLLMEIARALRKLLLEGKLHSNKRIIRFLWLPEYSGAIAWLHWNYYKTGKILACINLDSVGESPEHIGTPLRISIPPHSSVNFLEDLFDYIAELVAGNERYGVLGGHQRKLRYDREIFSGVSDYTIFIDSYFNIPSVMLSHEDPYSGTNLDTMKNVDATELLRVGLIAATAGFILSAPSIELARQILLFQKTGALNRINMCVKKALETIYNSEAPHLDIKFFNEVGKVSSLIKREEKNLGALLTYFRNDEFQERVNEIVRFFKFFSLNELKSLEKALRERARELGCQISRLNTLPREFREAQILIPEKMLNAPFKGVFKKVIFQRLPSDTKEWLRSNSLSRKNNVYGEIHNLINGENSIFDIYIALDLEFGGIQLVDVKAYIMLMQKMKLVNIKMVMKEERPEAIDKPREEIIIMSEKDLELDEDIEEVYKGAQQNVALVEVSPRDLDKIPVFSEDDLELDQLLDEIKVIETKLETREDGKVGPPIIADMKIPDWDIKSIEKNLKNIVVEDTGEKDEASQEILIDDLEDLDLDLNLDGLEERLIGMGKKTSGFEDRETSLDFENSFKNFERTKTGGIASGNEDGMDFWSIEQ